MESLDIKRETLNDEKNSKNYFWSGVRWAAVYLLLILLIAIGIGIYLMILKGANIAVLALVPLGMFQVHPFLIWFVFLGKILWDSNRSKKPGLLKGFMLGTVVLEILGILLAVVSLANTQMG